ncbi:S8 family serine peptidase [Tenacibaculum sp. C7A-26P2]|uniref:S8 family serine peptidase n=1 Tax=Tenacibaculum sp. C7A-26P2 TaxID=3447504 RepID=UPI003F85356D
MIHKYFKSLVFASTFIGLGLNIQMQAQDKREVEKIRKGYNLKKLERLKQSLHKKAFDEKQKALSLAKKKGWKERFTTENGNLVELQKIVDGKPIYFTTYNSAAAKSTRTNHLHSGGSLGLNLMGKNLTAHVWDAGIARSSHREYDGNGGRNRFSIGDGTNDIDSHAAHVTGTIIASGVTASAKGMAPHAKAVGYDWNYDKSEAIRAASNGMLISNHSYGYRASQIPDYYFGAYIRESRDWDEIMFNAPQYLMVVAAGNDGNDNRSNGIPLNGNSSFDKLSAKATSKNNLVVANARDANIDATGNLISVSINSGSSEGPTDDYRIKPDIAGNGTGVYSTFHNNDSSYGSLTGTSMASPNVTGSLLLLQEHYKNTHGSFMRAASLKGLALHTADDAGRSGPDAVFGWGLLNTKKAAQVITERGSKSKIEELTLKSGETYTVTVNSDGKSPLLASISWTDRPGTANRGVANSSTPVLVNDLDIRVKKTGQSYLPYKLTSPTTNTKGDNNVDPYERVDIANASGTYTITVTHKGNLTGGNQNFTLIVSGIGASGGGGTPTITCSETVRDFPYNQGFESGFGWTQLLGDNGNWTRKSGSTTSDKTGPSSAIEKRYYMYLEASTRGFGSIGSNATAILESPCFDLSSVTSASFGFKNHMYGVHMGTLRVQASTDGSSWKDIWTASGDKGNQWNAVSLDLSSYLGNKLKLRFVGKTGRSYKSDIAIDDLSLTTSGAASDGQAPTAPSNLSVSNITQTETTLSWTASSDNIGVTGYNIYQGSTKIVTVTGTTHKVTGLKANSRYTFFVKAIDKVGNESASSNSITVLTDTASVNYCTSKGNSSTFEWIDYVSFGGMTNTSRGTGGYGDYTDKVATVSRNSTNRLYFSAGFYRTIYKEDWAIWIDYNQDGVFSDDEKVVSTSSRTSRNLYTNIKIPSTALLGKTRMRVSMTDRGTLSPCKTLEYGEVEDYSVNITSSSDAVKFSDDNAQSFDNGLFDNESIFYPNPVTDDTITIRFGTGKHISYSITDFKGGLLDEGNIPNNSKLNVSFLKRGVAYNLLVNDGQKSKTAKIVRK